MILITIASIGTLCTMYFVSEVITLSRKLKLLEADIKHVQNAISYETTLYDAQSEYEQLYETRIEEMKNELGIVLREGTQADVLANGIYNIDPDEEKEVRTKYATREVGE